MVQWCDEWAVLGRCAGGDKKYGDGQQYDMLEEGDEQAHGAAAARMAHSNGAGPSSAPAPAGRGRGMVLPAWMTSGGASTGAPGSAAGVIPPCSAVCFVDERSVAAMHRSQPYLRCCSRLHRGAKTDLVLREGATGGADAQVLTVEQAQAILERHRNKRKKKDKKDKKARKHKKSKKHKSDKTKKHKSSSKHRKSADESSSSDSESQ